MVEAMIVLCVPPGLVIVTVAPELVHNVGLSNRWYLSVEKQAWPGWSLIRARCKMGYRGSSCSSFRIA